MTPPPAAQDTIFALSSGALPAAIAVLRVSGPGAAQALRALAGRLPPPRRAVVRTLRAADGSALDRALVLWLPGPDNVTGEDMIELHLHGGRAVVAAVQATLGQQTGLRPATPGEFTRRAFINGRLDLAEAEGLADLIAADSERQRRQAVRLAEGGLGRLIEQWRNMVLRLAARIEAVIDYGDDEPDVLIAGDDGGQLAALVAEMAGALAQPPAERLRDGLRVVLAGPVNAGKSSLMNALAGRDVAIASPHAGTTRDLVEAMVVLDGVPLILVDSAGLRDGSDEVEQEGVARARGAIATADIVLWLGAPDAAPNAALCIHPRADLPGRKVAPAGTIAVSSRTSEGLTTLRRMLIARADTLLPPADSVALNERQRAILIEAKQELHAAGEAGAIVLVAEHLRLAVRALDQIGGRAGVEDMLDALFARFCIGK